MEEELNTRKLKILKFVVVFMGVLLLFGTIALFALIGYKLTKSASKNKVEVSVPVSPAAHGECDGGSFKIAVDGAILAGNLDRSRVLLTVGKQGKQELVIFDYCAGKIISRLNVVSSVKP